MARNQTLLTLLQDLRSELRLSGNPAHNSSVRDSHVRLLQRVQESLWEELDWPFLRVERFMAVQAGQRFYDPPADMSLDRVEDIYFKDGDIWHRVQNGIFEMNYNAWDSRLDERSWPVERWRVYEDLQVELWPIPAENGDPATQHGFLKFEGIRKLRPLVADDDRADLDDQLIVLYAAAELLAARGAEDAPIKLAAAERRKRSLTASFTKIKTFSLGGGDETYRHQPFIPRVHYRDKQTS
jgi:hypothetical protein